eukprot:10650803-Alexandrium_andersonii.AAC.1
MPRARRARTRLPPEAACAQFLGPNGYGRMHTHTHTLFATRGSGVTPAESQGNTGRTRQRTTSRTSTTEASAQSTTKEGRRAPN